MKKRVLITNSIPPVAYQTLRSKYSVTWNKSQLTESQLQKVVKPYHALLTTLADPITSRVLEAGSNLQCVANYAVGFNNIDIQAAKTKGVWVTNTPDVLTEATADIAWALLLACARRLPEGERMVRTGKFKGWHPLMLLGLDLKGKTLGLYGFGRIGQAVARRGRGWDLQVLYHQRHRVSRKLERELNARFVPFDELNNKSDFISVHTPLTSETRYRFRAKEFKRMKRSCIFINTARGLIHREKDLVTALKGHWIHSAGLDVYEAEPKVNSALLGLPNCTLLPHLGSATFETRNKMALLTAQNIDRVLSGIKPRTPVFNF